MRHSAPANDTLRTPTFKQGKPSNPSIHVCTGTEERRASKISQTQNVLDEINVYIADSRVIPARSAGYIMLRVPQVESRKLAPGEGILAVAEQFLRKCEGHPTLLAVVKIDANGHALTSILNSGDEEISIQAETLFGTFHPRLDQSVNKDQISALNCDPPRKRRKGVKDDATWHAGLSAEKNQLSEAERREWILREFRLAEAPWLRNDAAGLATAVELLLEYFDVLSYKGEYGKTTLVEHAIHTQDVPRDNALVEHDEAFSNRPSITRFPLKQRDWVTTAL